MISLVASANPHDASSRHSNVAIILKGNAWMDIYKSELAVALASGYSLQSPPPGFYESHRNIAELKTQLLTEKEIKKEAINMINLAGLNDSVKIAMFYLADRDIVKSLIGAAERDAKVEIILDQNKDAFGYKKIGIPNKQAALELIKKTANKIKIRWYETNGEQFHSKMLFVEKNSGYSMVLLGSANFTRRNIENFNLESDIFVMASSDSLFMREIKKYFEIIWNNENGVQYTANYEKYKDELWWKVLIYRIQESLGVSSF